MTLASIQLRGIRKFHPREQCRARLMCFPHAGGSATAFSQLSACLPPDIELLAVQYPGRQERRTDPPATDLSALAEEVVRAMPLFDDQPLALFGHSMGSLIAFEAARMVAGRQPLLRLFVSAARPPSLDWEVADVDSCDDAAIVADLRRLGGVPEQLLAERDLREEMLRVVRADYRLVRRYRHQAGEPLAVPITALAGDTDPKNTAAVAWAWVRHTRLSCGVKVLPGGHFYLNDQLPAVAGLIARCLDHDLTARAAWRAPGEGSR